MDLLVKPLPTSPPPIFKWDSAADRIGHSPHFAIDSHSSTVLLHFLWSEIVHWSRLVTGKEYNPFEVRLPSVLVLFWWWSKHVKLCRKNKCWGEKCTSLSEVNFLKHWVFIFLRHWGGQNVTLPASPSDRKFSFLISAFPVHSASFFFVSQSLHRKTCYMNSDRNFDLFFMKGVSPRHHLRDRLGVSCQMWDTPVPVLYTRSLHSMDYLPSCGAGCISVHVSCVFFRSYFTSAFWGWWWCVEGGYGGGGGGVILFQITGGQVAWGSRNMSEPPPDPIFP